VDNPGCTCIRCENSLNELAISQSEITTQSCSPILPTESVGTLIEQSGLLPIVSFHNHVNSALELSSPYSTALWLH